ncbi:hypothetical protein BGZ60DRAFT_421433 [Tricladium varicosporioides]|nr:hypothetical protein BGZ60DRAFT_421433 [Hymenoscyphus varicosporioides]
MSVHSNNPDMVRFTCGATSSSAPGKATKVWSTTVSRNNIVTTPKGNQHHWQWIEGWVSAGKDVCQRDEWPPRSFWPTKKRNQLGQLVRFLPGPENGGAGSMFNSFCERNGERAADGKKNAKLHTTVSSLERVAVTSGVTTTITSVQVQVPQPVFEITDWDGLPRDAGDPDGLKKNPCWPSMIVPDDPGFALLTDDPYYQHNPRAAATVTNYAKAPDPTITSGKVPLWSVNVPASQSSADESMDDLDATTTAATRARARARGADLVRRVENEIVGEELADAEERRGMVKRGMWVEVVIASPAETEAIPTPVVEVKDPVITLKTVARTKISAGLPETTGI